jgi:hypothetical protein
MAAGAAAVYAAHAVMIRHAAKMNDPRAPRAAGASFPSQRPSRRNADSEFSALSTSQQ